MPTIPHKLRALVAMRHDGQSVEPGEPFFATAVDAPFLVAAKLAELFEEVKAEVVTAAMKPPASTEVVTSGDEAGGDAPGVPDVASMTVPAVIALLPTLSDDGYGALKAAEAAGKNRRGLVAAFTEEDARRAAQAGGGEPADDNAEAS